MREYRATNVKMIEQIDAALIKLSPVSPGS
jgi:hypothetical protein